MAMVVRSNIMAINANRQLGMNNSQVGKSLEKLASGYRINRAGDDASGLAISEKMKAQIRGLETASSNSQDGISLVQTAEGALTEVHDMLNRMVELAGKSANGTMDNEVDRKSLQKEMDALKDEIDRIADGTNFNGTKLLNGSLGAAVSQTSAVNGASTISVATKTVSSFAYSDITGGDTIIYGGVTLTEGATGDFTSAATFVSAWNSDSTLSALWTASTDGTNITMTAASTGATPAFASTGTATLTVTGSVGDAGGTPTTTGAKTTLDFTKISSVSDAIGTVIDIGGTKYEFVKTGEAGKVEGSTVIELATGDDAKAKFIAAFNPDNTGSYTASVVGNTVEIASDATTGVEKALEATISGKGLTLQVGDTADPYNKVNVSINNMGCVGLGIDAISVADQDSASAALELLKNSSGGGAINIVSSTRADLGALQNRLEHTINNLDVAAENMSAANSRIRDTDMAKQMMEYTKMNVLTQAAQAMLAQANAQPQSILQLLQ